MHSAVETRNMCLNSLFITVHLLKTALLQCSITHMSITPMSGHTHPAITLFLCNSEANPQCRKLTHTHEKPGARSSDRQQYFTLLSQPRFLPETLRWPSCLRVSVFFLCVVLSLFGFLCLVLVLHRHLAFLPLPPHRVQQRGFSSVLRPDG